MGKFKRFRRINTVRKVILSAAAIVMALGSAPAIASGSGGGGGGFGSYSGGSGASSRLTEAQKLERRGKSQVRKRITCKKCSYHNRLNQQTAPEVAKAVRGGQFKLNDKNREAVLFYLRKRYGV